jgi:hypothetical protein
MRKTAETENSPPTPHPIRSLLRARLQGQSDIWLAGKLAGVACNPELHVLARVVHGHGELVVVAVLDELEFDSGVRLLERGDGSGVGLRDLLVAGGVLRPLPKYADSISVVEIGGADDADHLVVGIRLLGVLSDVVNEGRTVVAHSQRKGSRLRFLDLAFGIFPHRHHNGLFVVADYRVEMVVVLVMEEDGSLSVHDRIRVDMPLEEVVDLRIAGRILSPLPGREHRIPDSETLGERERAGLVDCVGKPVDLAAVDLHCGIGVWMDIRLRSRENMRRVI